MKPASQDNSTYENSVRIPKEAFDGLRIEYRRKAGIPNKGFAIISRKDQLHNESILKDGIKDFASQKYWLSSAKAYKSSIQIGVNSSLKNYLSMDKLSLYNKCKSFLKEIGLPEAYSYHALDFLAATDKELLNFMSEEDIFLNIATRYRLNTTRVLPEVTKEGFAVPTPSKLESCISSTLPRPFSPLFFEMVNFAGTFLKDRNIPKHFERCLIYGYADNMRNANHAVLHAHDGRELTSIVNQAMSSIENFWWVPKQLLAKFKQLRMYVKNLFPNSQLLEFLMLSYLSHYCGYGFEQDKLRGIGPGEVIEGIQKSNRLALRLAYSETKKGWTILDSSPHPHSYIFEELTLLLRKLDRVNPVQRKLKLSTERGYSKLHASKDGIEGIFENVEYA